MKLGTLFWATCCIFAIPLWLLVYFTVTSDSPKENSEETSYEQLDREFKTYALKPCMEMRLSIERGLTRPLIALDIDSYLIEEVFDGIAGTLRLDYPIYAAMTFDERKAVFDIARDECMGTIR